MTANPKPDAVTADTSVKDYLDALDGNLQVVCRSLLSASDEITRLNAELAEAKESAKSAWGQWDALQDLLGASKEVGFAFDEVARMKASLGDAVAEINFLRAELAAADDRAKDAHAVGFAAGIEAAVKPLTDSEAYSAALSYRHDLGLLTDIAQRALGQTASAWHIALSHRIRALTPPDITAAAARALLADDVAPLKMAEDMTGTMRATEKGAPPWNQWSERQKAFAVDTVRAALRALAEVKP